MAIKDNRRNSAAVQPASAGGAGGGSGGVSAERASGVSGGHGQTSESSGGGKLGVWALAGVVVSSMIGGGIYSLPQNMAAGASVGAVLLAWLITGIGVYFLANTFRILSVVKPDLRRAFICTAGQVSARMSALPSGGRTGCARFAATSVMP